MWRLPWWLPLWEPGTRRDPCWNIERRFCLRLFSLHQPRGPPSTYHYAITFQLLSRSRAGRAVVETLSSPSTSLGENALPEAAAIESVVFARAL